MIGLVNFQVCGVDEHLHLDDTAIRADIQDLASELVGKVCDRFEMLMLETQSLAHNEFARVEILGLCALL